MEDRTGLDKAYGLESESFVPEGDTLYVAGTKNLRDVWDDLKIPFGLTSWADRYEQADRVRRLAADQKGRGAQSGRRCGAQARQEPPRKESADGDVRRPRLLLHGVRASTSSLARPGGCPGLWSPDDSAGEPALVPEARGTKRRGVSKGEEVQRRRSKENRLCAQT